MKLVAYLRVSSDSQIDGFGLDVQEKAIRDWARREAHRIVMVETDAGISGALQAAERPGLTAALTAVESNRADGLVVARLDRLARALTVQEAALAMIWRLGKPVYAADAGEVLRDDPDDPMRTALRQVVGVFSELDRRMVSKRLRDGRTVKASTGKKATGAYAYGFTGSGRGRDRDASELPEEQRAVHRIIELRSRDFSYRQIATVLDREGLRPRRATKWSPMSVRSVVLRASSPKAASVSAGKARHSRADEGRIMRTEEVGV